MEWYCMHWYLCFIAFLNVKGTFQETQAQQECAYTNSLSLISCSDVKLSCKANTRIKILNAVCGVRKSSGRPCLPYTYTSKCYAQTSCCRNEFGDVRWPMADEHMHRLQQICSGKKQCLFNAPVGQQINYAIHYCYVYYRCTNEPITATKISYITTTTTSGLDTLTTSVISSYPGIHGIKKSHVATLDTTTPESSSDLPVPLSAVIVPVIVAVIGIVLGIVFVRQKRNRQRQPKTIDMCTVDLHTTNRTSNQYDTISPSATEQSFSTKDCGSRPHYSSAQNAETSAKLRVDTKAELIETVVDHYSKINLGPTESNENVDKPEVHYNVVNDDNVMTDRTEVAEYFILEAENYETNPQNTKTIDTAEATAEYFILETENTYNDINPVDIEEYDDKESMPDTEYNRIILFPSTSITIDPNYDELGIGKDGSNSDYSSLGDHMVKFTEVDNSHTAYIRTLPNDQNDQYAHLKNTDVKTSNV